jgi:hypothetical protein
MLAHSEALKFLMSTKTCDDDERPHYHWVSLLNFLPSKLRTNESTFLPICLLSFVPSLSFFHSILPPLVLPCFTPPTYFPLPLFPSRFLLIFISSSPNYSVLFLSSSFFIHFSNFLFLSFQFLIPFLHYFTFYLYFPGL